MKTYYHFKIKGSRNRSTVLLTQDGLGVYKTLINRANYDLQLNKTPLLCAKLMLDIKPAAVINAGQIIANYRDIPTGLEYFEFPDTESLMTVSVTKKGIELQRMIDRLPFLAPAKQIYKVAQKIIEADEVQDISGRAFDVLMYQLWQRNEELINKLGYEYQDEEPETPEEENPEDDEIPNF